MASQNLHSLRSLRPWPIRSRRCCCAGHPAVAWTQSRNISQSFLKKKAAANAEWARRKEEVEAGVRKHVLDVIEERGLIKDMAGRPELIRKVILENRIGAYVGIDPTGDSLHIGHLIPLMPLFWFYFHGMRTYSLLGGATARVGDPTGRLKDRPLLRNSDIAMNMAKLQHQLKRMWANVKLMGENYGHKPMWGGEPHIRNNNEWFNKLPLYDFLKRLGRHVRVGPMLSRESVKRKFEEGDGLSFGELAYPLMQGWDFWQLYSVLNVQCQVGGSDQFGNIVTGIDCVKICRAAETDPHQQIPDHWTKEPFGFTTPLITDAAGVKLGKSETNSVWLDITKTSAFDLYGYFVRRSDEEVEKLLKLFTFLPLEHIATIMEHHRQNPPQRMAQHVLAFEVVSLVHSPQIAVRERLQHRVMYAKNPFSLPPGIITSDNNIKRSDINEIDGIQMAVQHAQTDKIELPRSLILSESVNKIFYAAGLASSSSVAHRLIKDGGAYIAAEPGNMQRTMIPGFLDWVPAKLWKGGELSKFIIDDDTLIIRRGKHNVRIIKLVSDEKWQQEGRTYRGQAFTGRIRRLKKALAEAKAEGKIIDFNEAGLTKTVPNNPDLRFPEGPRGKPTNSATDTSGVNWDVFDEFEKKAEKADEGDSSESSEKKGGW